MPVFPTHFMILMCNIYGQVSLVRMVFTSLYSSSNMIRDFESVNCYFHRYLSEWPDLVMVMLSLKMEGYSHQQKSPASTTHRPATSFTWQALFKGVHIRTFQVFMIIFAYVIITYLFIACVADFRITKATAGKKTPIFVYK